MLRVCPAAGCCVVEGDVVIHDHEDQDDESDEGASESSDEGEDGDDDDDDWDEEDGDDDGAACARCASARMTVPDTRVSCAQAPRRVAAAALWLARAAG